jgi:phage host-nuclease inhibitor protein Gam
MTVSNGLADFLEGLGTPAGFTEPDYTAETPTTEAPAFALSNDDEALWAMRKLARAQRQIDEVKRLAQIEIDRINLWIANESSQHSRQIDYLEVLLSDYLIRVRDDETDGRKTLTFPDGSVKSRVVASKVGVTDAEAFLSWAEANGHSEWVRVKREADLTTIKQAVDYNGAEVIDPLTGHIIEGLEHIEGGLSVSVKVVN